MRDAVSQFAAFVNRTWHFWRAVTPKLSWKRKCPKQVQHSGRILTLLRIDLRVGALEIAVGDHCRRAMTRARYVNHVQVVLTNHAIQVNIGEALSGIGAPMPEKPILKVLGNQRLSQQGIVAQV